MNSLARRDAAVFLLSVGLGAGIWLLSPAITGQKEPWDSEGPYYHLALFVAGILPAALVQHRWWRWPIGTLVGQILVTVPLVLRSPFGILGWFYMTVDMLYCLVGTGVGAVCGVLVRRILSRQVGDAA